MCHYLYYKPNIILSKTDGFTVFNVNVSLATKHPVSDIISYCNGWHNTFLWKLLQSDVFFHWISVLL